MLIPETSQINLKCGAEVSQQKSPFCIQWLLMMLLIGFLLIAPVTAASIYADFTVSPVNGTAPLMVKCIDASTGGPSFYNYNFGDGTNAIDKNPVHTYRFPGVYSITLTILKYDSATNSMISSGTTKTNIVIVNRVPFVPPVAGFTASPLTGKAPLMVSFTDQSTGNPTFYNYDFGDGINMTGPNPVHTYGYPGNYTVKLTVMKNNVANGTIIGSSSVQKDLIVVSNNTPVPQIPVMCNQPYGLCTIAKCEPLKSDPTKALCTCLIENGVSLGMTNCSERQPVDLYYSGTNGWMITGGASVGQLISTYSFINSLPTEGGKIPNRYIDPNYTGNIILRPCDAPLWANCLDMQCIVPPADPNENTSGDHKAADHAICKCALINNTPKFYMAASEGEASCNDSGICQRNIWSAAFIDSMNSGIKLLKAYLAAHPNQDPAQQYAMPICQSCENGT